METGEGSLAPSGLSYGSIIQLTEETGNLPPSGNVASSWWEKRKRRIFRKKILYKRLPFLQWLQKYSLKDLIADLIAGISVGVTLIPQALAYATVAGLPPQVSAFHLCKRFG